ncbi:MAG: metalloregulator ArsR/SmtB family transcription factor [Cyanobacteriota bacterium]|nr:metalloregulator ArsR/SmtB family transcription factor [Cyanobacteriota bacterium]
MPRASLATPIDAADTHVAVLLKALADPLRIDIVQALADGERCVCDLTERLGLAQSRLSFHLKVMRQAGVLRTREEGRWVYYRLEPEAIRQLQHWLTALESLSGRAAPACP